MKKVLSVFSAATLIFQTGCTDLINEESGQQLKADKQYSSLSINMASEADRSAFPVNQIKYAKITVSGSDILTADEPFLENIAVTNGSVSKVTVEKIPVGNNRIVTVEGYDESKKLVPSVRLRAVCDIKAGNNSVTVNRSTTSYGNVIYSLKNFFPDLHNPGEQTASELIKLMAAVDNTVHPYLFDYQNLVGGYMAYTPLLDKSKYVLQTASYTFDYLLNDNFTIEVEDPVSEKVFYAKAGMARKVSGIAPGTWNVLIKDSSGKILESQEVTFNSGENQVIKHFPHEGVAVLMRQSKGYDYIHFWDCSSSSYKNTTWPGVKFSKTVQADSTAEETSYYVYDFSGASSVKVLVTNSSGSKYCAENMILEQAGVYCVHNSGAELLTESKTVDPDFKLSDYAITEENYKTFYYDDSAKKRIIMLFNPDVMGSKSASKIKVYFNKGINDETKFLGKAYGFTKDASGVWYALVPYADIRETNQSGQPTYKIKVDDSDFDCVAKLRAAGLEGYVYTKFDVKNVRDTLPVIIYNRQNKAQIIDRLEREKTYKHVEDFDLTTEKGQMEITNFRCIPGTSKIYRSYHPLSATKTAFGTEPYRMYYLGVLGKKYGIKADINVSSDKSTVLATTNVYDGVSACKDVSNYIPEYYKPIYNDKDNKILYLVNKAGGFGYDLCYIHSDTDEMAQAMGEIVKFINKTEGPYQLHCAIGTDRTGISCAILSALCGASYSEIEEDYCKSFDMGILEYRGPGCVRYALEQFIGSEDIDEETDIQEKAIAHLVEKGGVTRAQIEAMIAKVQ